MGWLVHLLEQFDEGALIVDYSGHGSTEVLSHELVMNKADMSALSSPRLPFWITASCDIAPFDSPLESMGLNLIRNAKGGAIGLLSTTRTVYANLNQTINRSFTKYVLASDKSGWRYALGDALRLAKNELVTSGVGETDLTVNKIHYVLLGDPALKLALPELTAVVDSFAGVSSTAVGKADLPKWTPLRISCQRLWTAAITGLLSSHSSPRSWILSAECLQKRDTSTCIWMAVLL